MSDGVTFHSGSFTKRVLDRRKGASARRGEALQAHLRQHRLCAWCLDAGERVIACAAVEATEGLRSACRRHQLTRNAARGGQG